MLIIETSSVTVKCRTAIKALFLFLKVCQSVMLDILSCAFAYISCLTNCFNKVHTTSFPKNICPQYNFVLFVFQKDTFYRVDHLQILVSSSDNFLRARVDQWVW